MEKLFELSCQDQTLNPQVGTFTDASQTTGTFTLEDGEYYLTNGDTKGFYAYKPVALQSGLVDDSKIIIEFDLKVAAASVNTHTIIGTYAGVDGSGIPTGAKITLQYAAGDIELVLGSGTTATLIAAADVVVDQWYHFRIDCALDAPTESTYQVKIDGVLITTVTGATTDYELEIISVLGNDLHACDECGIKNITLVTETNIYVGRTALDQVLQDVKDYADAEFVPVAGGAVITGTTIAKTTNDSYATYCGGNSFDSGASVRVHGKDFTDSLYAGAALIRARNNSGFFDLFLKPNGTVTLSNWQHTLINRNDAYGEMVIYGGDVRNHGGSILLEGSDWTTDPGSVIFVPNRNGQEKLMFLRPDGTWLWNGTAVQITSDQRYKQQITEIDDKLLDAWEDVELSQFKYNDAVNEKGDNARLHTGYVVQQIQKACEKHGVDISQYGLFCHEEYAEETEEVEVTQKDGTKTKERKVIREANEHYSLRYTEALIVECKYLRRCVERLVARIEQLEGNKEVEK